MALLVVVASTSVGLQVGVAAAQNPLIILNFSDVSEIERIQTVPDSSLQAQANLFIYAPSSAPAVSGRVEPSRVGEIQPD